MDRGKRNKKRLLSLLLALEMVLSSFAGSAKEAKADAGIIVDISSWIQADGNTVTITPPEGQKYAFDHVESDIVGYSYNFAMYTQRGATIPGTVTAENYSDFEHLLVDKDDLEFLEGQKTIELSAEEAVIIYSYDETKNYQDRWYAITGVGFYANHQNHRWDYRVPDSYTCYAACKENYCPYYVTDLWENPEEATVSCTFSVENQTMETEGTPYSGATIVKNNWDAAGLDEPKLQYQWNGDPYEAPTAPGSYKVRLYINENWYTSFRSFKYTLPGIKSIVVNVAENIPSVIYGNMVSDCDFGNFFTVPEDADYLIVPGEGMVFKLEDDRSVSWLDYGYVIQDDENYVWNFIVVPKDPNGLFDEDVTVTSPFSTLCISFRISERNSASFAAALSIISAICDC